MLRECKKFLIYSIYVRIYAKVHRVENMDGSLGFLRMKCTATFLSVWKVSGISE